MSGTLLTLEGLVLRFGRRGALALDDVSATLGRGETLGIVGESGSGKSTLALVAAGLLRPAGGVVRYGGRGIGMVFQDPAGSLDPLWRVGDSIAEPLRARRPLPAAADVRKRVATLLEQVGLSPEDAGRLPGTLSGGQRQRVSIARALAAEPDLLICDEPTSALDASVQAQVLTLLRGLQAGHGFAMLFVSHNLAVVRHMAQRIVVMLLGRVVESGPASLVLGAPLHPYTQLLVGSVPDPAAIGVAPGLPAGEPPSPLNPPSGCPFHPRCPFAVERCARERPAAAAWEQRVVACHRAGEIAAGAEAGGT